MASCSKKIYPAYEITDQTAFIAGKEENQTTSIIEFPVVIPLDYLERALDSIIPDRYEEHDREVDCLDFDIIDINFDACKVDGGMDIGGLSFIPYDTGFIATVPLEGKMTYKWKWKSLLTFGSWKEESKDLHFKGKMDLVLNPKVGRDLRLIPNHDIRFHFDEAYFHFGTKINVRSYLARYLNKSVKSLIDEYIEEHQDQFQLANHIEPVWSQLADPILILEDQHVWLKIEPQNLYYQNLNYTDSAFIFGLGLETRLTTVWGNKPDTLQINPISEIKITDSLSSNFGIKLPILITYDKLSQLVNENFSGNEFIINSDLKINPSNVQVLGVEDNITIKLNFNAQYKNKKATGWLYFNSIPVYDRQNYVLYLKEIDFDLKTKNLLFKVSKWLYDNKINEELEKKAYFELGSYIEKSKISLIDIINQNYWDNKIQLEGKLNYFEVDDFILHPEGILLILNMSGELRATLQKFISN